MPQTPARIVIFLLVVAALVWLTLEGYEFSWTGFGATEITDATAPPKRLWDWLDLLIVPIVLAVGAFLLDSSRRQSDARVEEDRQRQQILDDYFSYLSELILDKDLMDANVSQSVRGLARTRTLAALRMLDGKRKSQLLQFLYEAALITREPVIDLNGADFREADLAGATLIEAELRGVYFSESSFVGASLKGADIRGSSFDGSNMSNVKFSGANLTQSRFDNAKFKGAALDGVISEGASFKNVKLTDVQRKQIEEGQ